VDLDRYRSAIPEVAPLLGRPAGFRPLPQRTVAAALLAAERAFIGRPPYLTALDAICRVLAAGVVDPDGSAPLGSPADWATLTPDELDGAMARWLVVQESAIPDRPLDAEIKLRMLEGSDMQTSLDAALAATNSDPAVLFGCPAADLHAGQVLYFFALRRAHSDLYDEIDEGKTRKVSMKWLRVEARRSETTKAKRVKLSKSTGLARKKRWGSLR
jgi:hypothetical protein